VQQKCFYLFSSAGAPESLMQSDQEDMNDGSPLSPEARTGQGIMKQSSTSSRTSAGSWASLSLTSASRARRNWHRAMQVLRLFLLCCSIWLLRATLRYSGSSTPQQIDVAFQTYLMHRVTCTVAFDWQLRIIVSAATLLLRQFF
jgi:hypothetical protein